MAFDNGLISFKLTARHNLAIIRSIFFNLIVAFGYCCRCLQFLSDFVNFPLILDKQRVGASLHKLNIPGNNSDLNFHLRHKKSRNFDVVLWLTDFTGKEMLYFYYYIFWVCFHFPLTSFDFYIFWLFFHFTVTSFDLDIFWLFSHFTLTSCDYDTFWLLHLDGNKVVSSQTCNTVDGEDTLCI